MKKPLKAGDRVRVYGSDQVFIRNAGCVDGTIVSSHNSNLIEIAHDKSALFDGLTILAHPKQCRRLVKKKKQHKIWWMVDKGKGFEPRMFIEKGNAIYYTKNIKSKRIIPLLEISEEKARKLMGDK